MSDSMKQQCVDEMGEHLFSCYESFLESGEISNAEAVCSEWIIDGRDPEDGTYEFMFINDLTSV